MSGAMFKPRHPSRIRRIIAALSGLPSRLLKRLEDFGWLMIKIANTVRFEQFWQEASARNPSLKTVPSFTAGKTKHPIWNITIEQLKALGPAGTILEFGTNNGGWLSYFHKRVPETMVLHGFDSFEGLPGEWDGLPAGSIKGYGLPVVLWGDDPAQRAELLRRFGETGTMPVPPQPNVVIHSGLFMNTMPAYMAGADLSDIRLIHFDADLYISTRPVLDAVCGLLTHEYLILFDEFYSANHEFRAWQEFTELYKIDNWRIEATSDDAVQVLIRVLPRADRAAGGGGKPVGPAGG